MTPMQILAGMLLSMILLVGICVYMQPMMSECPTAHPGIICPMHETSALSFWQNAVILSRRVVELTVLVLVLLAAWIVMKNRSELFSQRILYDRLYLPRLPLPYLQELFSQGILHPKVF